MKFKKEIISLGVIVAISSSISIGVQARDTDWTV